MLRQSRFLALLLLIALLVPQAVHAQTEQTQIINVDAPAMNATVSGVVTITGWAIDPSAAQGTGVDAVHVYVDGEAGQGGRLLGGAKYGNPRQDVASARGGPRYAPSGFEYSWDTLSVSPGPHTLYVYARNAAGEWGFAQVPVTVSPDRRPPQNTTPPPPSTGTATTPPAPPSTGTTGTTPPAPPTTGTTGTAPPSRPTTGATTTGATAGGTRANAAAGLPAATPGLPRLNEHPTDDNVAQIISLTPPPSGIRWSEVAAEYDDEEDLSVVLLGLLANDRAQAWLALPPEQQETFLKQLMVNLGESYLSDDAFLVGVVCRLQVPKKEDLPSFVQERYIRQQADGTYRATWPDVISGYDVTSGKMIFKSARMSDAGPTITK